MIIRESHMGRGLFGFLSGAWMLFAVLCAWLGDDVTSRQWVYLMGVPGGNWFWSIVFCGGALAGLLGVTTHLYRLTAAGLFVDGLACLLIASFYVFAPLIDPGMITLGYVVWFITAVLSFFAAVVSWAPIRWF